MDIYYLDNFRGFYKTFIPINKINFLIGENSTGKTSFLSLIKLISHPLFLTQQEFNTDEIRLGYYDDIANSRKQKYFDIGLKKDYEKKQKIVAFKMRFIEKSGRPILSHFRIITENNRDIIIYVGENNELSYKSKTVNKLNFLRNERDEIRFFKEWIIEENYPGRRKKIKSQRKNLPLAYNFMFAGEQLKIPSILNISLELNSFSWFAPVRAKPKRIYEQFFRRQKPSPEGEHTPVILKKLLSKRDPNHIEKIGLIEKFGKESGLFSKINTKPLSNDISSPFEINIKLKSKYYTISNLGYGISQILPIIADIADSTEGDWFLLQQPEVHLHPKSQAAFGEFVFQNYLKYKLNFIIETHSDYLVDRFRLNYHREDLSKTEAQVLFFERKGNENKVTPILILENGKYAEEQPNSFKEFFIKEELNLLQI